MPRANAYGRFNFAQGTRQRFTSPDATSRNVVSCRDMPIHPKATANLIGVANNHIERRSELLILDAAHLDDGAIAWAALPSVSEAPVHGIRAPEQDLAV
jgi:hypothetical protein